MQVWEVAAQLLGLALSIGVLKGIEATHVPQNVLWIWALAQTGHVALRFKSLSSLQLTVVNQKRACLLIRAHLEGKPLPGAPFSRSWYDEECSAVQECGFTPSINDIPLSCYIYMNGSNTPILHCIL